MESLVPQYVKLQFGHWPAIIFFGFPRLGENRLGSESGKKLDNGFCLGESPAEATLEEESQGQKPPLKASGQMDDS
jgi:hypothetical protein